ncbi:MAG: hypothetical protein ACU0CI_04300 [Shimia sp.]
MTKALPIVALMAFALAGCETATTASAPAAPAGPGVEKEIWFGPDGCTYEMSLVNGERVGMELIAKGNEGPCVGA